jgi:hypothetical protein
LPIEKKQIERYPLFAGEPVANDGFSSSRPRRAASETLGGRGGSSFPGKREYKISILEKFGFPAPLATHASRTLAIFLCTVVDDGDRPFFTGFSVRRLVLFCGEM